MQTNLQKLTMSPHKLAQQLSMRLGDAATLFVLPGHGENFEGKVVEVHHCTREGRITVKLAKEGTAAVGGSAQIEGPDRIIRFDPSSATIARFRDTTDRLALSESTLGLLVIEPAKRR
jgi:hypothetical protein